MPRSLTPPAAIRPDASAITDALLDARKLMARSEADALACGKTLLKAKELCVQAGRGWYDELARFDISPRTACRYMDLARPKEDTGQESDSGPAASTNADPGDEDDAPTPVRRRPSAEQRLDAAEDSPRVRAARRVLQGLDLIGPALALLDLADYQAHEAALRRLRRDVTRGATC